MNTERPTEPSEELECVLASGGKRVSETFVLEYNPRETSYNLVCDPEPGNDRANGLAWAFDRLHTSRESWENLEKSLWSKPVGRNPSV